MTVTDQVGKYAGGAKTTFATATKVEGITVDGDTATFAFYSDGSSAYYGYYAIITANVTNYARNIISGSYKTPASSSYTFAGWATSASATTADYTTEQAVMNGITGGAGETVTLYAVQAYPHTLTVSNGSNIKTVSGGGGYVEDTAVTVSATTTSGTTCLSYSTPTWTAKATDGGTATGYFKSTTGASVEYVMGSTNDTLTATSTSSRNSYTITYNANGGTGTMSNTSGSCGAATTLRANTFTRDGYNFLGWSTSSSATSATYTDGQSITLSQTSTLALYAVWEVACSSTVSGTMQTFNPCDDVADGTSGSLTDSRDTQIYTVKKINGQWWMTKNLAIGCNGSGTSYGSSVSSKQLTSTDSDVSTSFSTPTARLSAASSSTSTADYSAGRMQCSSTYGAWYNYYAASAGTISGSSNTTVATSSICPLNWKLPTGPSTASDTDFNKLVGNTTSDEQTADDLKAFSVMAGGYYINGSLDNIEYGVWWSATASNSTSRYSPSYRSSNGRFYGGGSGYRYFGRYVRCVRSS